MKFERITIERFGGLTEFDTGDAPLNRLVVVSGPNEAGKSSLFTFLTAMLYGFYPASRERNPYSPWNGGDIDGRAILRLGDGRLLEVHRRLLASPWGQVGQNGRIEDIRNRQLDLTANVPREVFQKMYALTLNELAGLEGESWNAVQDRLIGSMGASDIVPPREVAEQLEQEADRLWRPDRRGKPRASVLGDELAELRQRRVAARDADRAIRQGADEQVRIREELRQAREERERYRQLREKIETLGPVRRQLQRIAELRETAGPASELEGLPADPRARREELETEQAQLEARLERLKAEDAEPRARMEAVTEEVRRLLGQGRAITALSARMSEVLHAGSRLAELDAEIRASAQGCEDEARELFAEPWAKLAGGMVAGAIERLPAGALRTAIREAREAAETTRRWAGEAGSAHTSGSGATGSAESAEAAEAGLAEKLQPVAGGACVALGIALFLAGGDGTTLRSLAVVLLFLGMMLLAGWWGARGARAANRAREEREREHAAKRRHEAAAVQRRAAALHREAAQSEAAARARLDALLEGLPLRETHRADPGPELAEGILRLQGHIRDRKSREDARSEIARKIGEVREELAAVHASAHAPVGQGADPAEPLLEPVRAIPLLEQALRKAEETAGAAERAAHERKRIARDREEVEAALQRCRAGLESLEARMEALGGGDPEKGVRAALERLKAGASADAFMAELERSHPDLVELCTRIAEAEATGTGWIFDEETRDSAAVREKELSHQVEELSARAEGIARDIDHKGNRETVDDVESATLEVREEIARLARERDRNVLLAHVLRRADRMFREAHQPDIVLRAARHMATITGGRYDGLSIGEEDRQRVFYLQGAGHSRPVPVEEPVSTGTREQFYLALRLAIVDHLDARGERLPLFMDEAFVNWDRERRGFGFDLLEKLSGERQIFVFTCHEGMADELEARGAHAIRLAPPQRAPK